VVLEADDLTLYLASDIWQGVKPGQQKLLVALSGFGRFWVYLEAPPARDEWPAGS
jgi:hypothetical protein